MSPKFAAEIQTIDRYLHALFQREVACPLPELERFWQSLNYSLFSPGKRFRPLLSLLTAQALQKPSEVVLPVAAAVELIHTYSLIHDDLPALDNDDLRRGQPTNHKVYGEATALLAGDGLLTLAFQVLALSDSPHAIQTVRLVSEAAGIRGMVGGQVLDIAGLPTNFSLLENIHALKTGALIRGAVEAAAVLCAATPQQQSQLREYGRQLGLAFQLADDLQDRDGFVSALGEAETRRLLKQAGDKAMESLACFSDSAAGLRELIKLNLERA